MTQLSCPPGVAQQRKRPLEYRIANSQWDRMAAFRLIYDHYLQAGLIQPNRFNLRVTLYHLLPATQIFLAVQDEDPVCTVSLIEDGPEGLPMESIYGAEVDSSREQGRRVAEVSCLAGYTNNFRSFLPIFVQLTRLMAQYARKNKIDQFLIAVHPKHADFYKRFMGFEQIGPIREYPSVRNAPAVACCLDFDRIDRERPKCWYDFFGIPLPDSQLNTISMTDEEFKDYRLVAELYEAMAMPTLSLPN